MTPEGLRAFAERHGLSAAAAAELVALAERGGAEATFFVAPAPETLLPEPPPAAETWAGAASETLPVDAGATIVPSGRGGATIAPFAAAPTLAPEDEASTLAPEGPRYTDLGPLGAGGMGEVRRVRDGTLHRVVAMKIARAELLANPGGVDRFLEEAQATAQLQHPGVVPVHDLGRLPDGRPYFTMNEVRGRTFTSVLREVHAASAGGAWSAGASGWTFRRLVAAFHQACEAVAYAHARGVLHRDLKPDNLMVGAYGEVLVLDWGLAKVKGGLPDDAIVTVRTGAGETRTGTVAGTPTYMPPEQARGEVDRLDARSDVYALGAILYELLAGRPPYEGHDGYLVLAAVLSGPPPRLVADDDGPPRPPALVRACERAMAREAADRYPDAAAFAADLLAWLDGARRREEALRVVVQADALLPEIAGLEKRAAALRREAGAQLAKAPAWESEAKKASGWGLEHRAEQLEARADLRRLDYVRALGAALTIEPELPDAHERLAAWYRAEHVAAEAARDRRARARAEVLLAAHAKALPADRPERARHLRYLEGTGAVSLITDPPGAEVVLHRFVVRNRRFVPAFDRVLGKTPLVEVPLPMGSYLLEIRAEGRPVVRYPVRVGREAHWDGVPPGAAAARPIEIPAPDALGDDDVYVPAGWFEAGGGPDGDLPAQRLWCDAFVIRRHPVTNREYIAFLDDLVAAGREVDALRWAPRQLARTFGEDGAMIYGREGDRFALVPDADGDVWDPDWPVMLVDFAGARAYAAWEAERSGRPWRLPWELEWEKAARGVDGRLYPWGDDADGSWACTRESQRERPLPAKVGAFPVDASPYGVRGLGGNVRDWCEDVEGTPRVVDGRVVAPLDAPGRRIERGGFWTGYLSAARAVRRYAVEPTGRLEVLGFRLARSW